MSESPTGFVGRMMKRAGYVPIARARELSDALARAKERSADLQRALEAAKKEVEEAKQKARERADRAQQEKSVLAARYEARTVKSEQRAEQVSKRVLEREAELRQNLQDARERIAWAEKATQLGREHLMAIEVKLDIVEGAIKVLDQRTRTALAGGRESREAARAPARVP